LVKINRAFSGSGGIPAPEKAEIVREMREQAMRKSYGKSDVSQKTVRMYNRTQTVVGQLLLCDILEEERIL